MSFSSTPLKDIREIENFKRCGYQYTKVAEKDGWFLFKMERKEIKYLNYELVKGIKAGDILRYPGTEHFGNSGFYLCGSVENIHRSLDKLKERDIPTDYFKDFVS